ncbi:hypothetical protein EYF80_014835 [Liparis tanakae]|uniref:Uncharacterized protein n=1 Tax=Liparis tanakae TaxID=230148 RepID=A0A4Z2IAD0_9TELE|nr:hypothetical protein EYF80_014835 [Liparis tanakae]
MVSLKLKLNGGCLIVKGTRSRLLTRDFEPIDAERHRPAEPHRAGRHQNLHVVIQSQSFPFGRNGARVHHHRTGFQHVLKTPVH